jgi:hypothetical protein
VHTTLVGIIMKLRKESIWRVSSSVESPMPVATVVSPLGVPGGVRFLTTPPAPNGPDSANRVFPETPLTVYAIPS